MKHNLAPIRPAMTAIAAVIVLSSTPLFAQATDPAATQSAPVVAPPSAPTVTDSAAAPVTAPAAAPETTAPEATAPAAPPAMKTMSTPVEHTADAPSETAASVAPVKHGTTSRTVADRASATHAAASTPMDRAAKSVAPSIAPKTVPAEQSPAAPAPTPAAQVDSPAPTAPITGTTSAQSTHIVADETLPIAAAVGVGLIALGGAGFALSRGRRRKVEDESVLQPTRRAAAPPVKAEPAEAVPSRAAPTAAATAAVGPDRLPNGFDLSRFGRHTRAAYLGPTPDNPSYSLKNRLKRASFFDQREREAAASGAAIPEPVAATAAQRQPENGQITVRLAPQRVSGRFGYVLQR